MSQTLTLEVSGRHAAQFGARARKVFEGRGGSIGRSEDCDWVLGASGVSRVHAMIRLLNGLYFIEDRSTNGMLLNGAPLVKGEPSMLGDGDRLTVDTFEIEVRLADAAAEPAAPPPPAYAPPPPPVYAPPPPPAPSYAAPLPADDPFDFDLLAPMTPAAPTAPAARPGALPAAGFGSSGDSGNLIPGWDDSPGGADDLDPLSFLGPADGSSLISASTTGSSTASPSWNHSPSTADSFRPPSTTPPMPAAAPPAAGGGPGMLPDNWDLTMGDFAPRPKPAAPPPAPAPAAAPPPRPMAPPPAAPPLPGGAAVLPPDVDQIFRTVVDGVMDVLRARAEIKNTFRLPVTIIQRSENNPLKFAPTPEDALARLLAPPTAGFLSGTAAFEDAFNDIRCHQMAMLAGIRAAFEQMVVQFSPERFENEGEGAGKRSGFMDFAGKGKQWEKYKEHWEAMNRNPDERFRRLFGEEFAKAYEEQLSRLKSARRMQQAGHR